MRQGESGLVAIRLPGSQNNAARSVKLPASFIDEMIYSLVFTGPGTTRTIRARAGKTVFVELEPGRWRIDVTAYYQVNQGTGNPYPVITELIAGKNIGYLNLFAGRESRADIHLTVLDEFF